MSTLDSDARARLDSDARARLEDPVLGTLTDTDPEGAWPQTYFGGELHLDAFPAPLRLRVTLVPAGVVSETLRQTVRDLEQRQHAIMARVLEGAFPWYLEMLGAWGEEAALLGPRKTDPLELRAWLDHPWLYLTSEENAFGLSFYWPVDEEHGLGLRFERSGEGFEVVDVGGADVALV